MTSPNPLLAAALEYANRNWAVFPCHPSKKTPATPNGFKDATTDHQRINEWWGEHPDYNIGIATGLTSKLLVVDVDRHEDVDGHVAWASLQKEHGEIRETWQCDTPNEGLHVYLFNPNGARSRVGLLPGLDIKADGGYVVAPPSRLPEGEYKRNNGCSDLALAPKWLIDALEGPATAHPPLPDMAFAEGVTEGSRNATTARLAGKYLAMGLGAEEVLALLSQWNQLNSPPLEQAELEAVIRSIARRELGLDTDVEDRDEKLAALSKRFGLHIENVRRIGGDSPHYEFAAEGKTVLMTVKELLNQHAWRVKLLSLTRCLPKKVGAKAKPSWDWYVQFMVDLAEEVEVGEEATAYGAMKGWLLAYLEPKLDSLKHSDEEVDTAGEPVWHEGGVAIHCGSLLKYLRLQRIDAGLTTAGLAQTLRRYEIGRVTVHFILSGGKRTTRSMWLVPQSFLDG